MLTTVFEDVQGRRLRVARLGSGPPVILLHGYPDNLQIWQALAPRLAKKCEVIAFDWPGAGYSDPWPGGATPEHLADRLHTLMDHWKLPRASIAGIDMGGQPALVFAAKYPERTNLCVPMNCLAFHDEQTSWEIGLLRRFGWNRGILRYFPGIVFRRALRTFLAPGCSMKPDLQDDLWNAFRKDEVRGYVSKMCAGYQGMLSHLPAHYARIQTSTLILWAERDKHFPPGHARRLNEAIRNSRLEILPGAHHWMILDRAEEVSRAILNALSF